MQGDPRHPHPPKTFKNPAKKKQARSGFSFLNQTTYQRKGEVFAYVGLPQNLKDLTELDRNQPQNDAIRP